MSFVREMRKDPRVASKILVRVEAKDFDRHYFSDNISTGGLFLLAIRPLPEETRVSLELFFPELNIPFRAKGEVVWKQRQYPTGFAIKFTEISAEAQRLIRHMLPARATA